MHLRTALNLRRTDGAARMANHTAIVRRTLTRRKRALHLWKSNPSTEIAQFRGQCLENQLSSSVALLSISGSRGAVAPSRSISGGRSCEAWCRIRCTSSKSGGSSKSSGCTRTSICSLPAFRVRPRDTASGGHPARNGIWLTGNAVKCGLFLTIRVVVPGE